jgi:hypothetical protein
MARNRKPSTLASNINSELSSNNSLTSAMPHVSSKSPREKLGDMVSNLNAEQGRNWGTDWSAKAASNPTQAYSKGKTKAYPVAKTVTMPNAPGGQPAGRTGGWDVSNPFPQTPPEAKSPVTLKGQGKSGKKQSGHSGSSLIHSTIRAMELLGEHEGNNKKVIEGMVNR